MAFTSSVAIFQSVRILIVFALAFVVAFALTPVFESLFLKFNLRKRNIRSENAAPIFHSLHKNKTNTITMAGVIIWFTIAILAFVFFVSNFLFGGFAGYLNFVNRAETYLPLAALIISALVGLADDMLGIRGIGDRDGGMKMGHKLVLYTMVALLGAMWFYFKLGWDVLYIPFFGNLTIGPWYVLVFIFVIVATAFSTNETDGLDGLAAGVLFFAYLAMAIVAFMMRRYDLAVMNGAILGALLAFLWFNIYPARFFMGDTGSMSLGVTLGVVAMLTNSALYLPFFGLILVVESASVIIQVFSKKFRKKKVFLSTPIHHHFEALGWPESQVVMRFWIIAAVAAVFGIVIFFLTRFV